MNLRNYQISIRELLMNQEAKAVLQREAPDILISLAGNVPLRKVINSARGKVPQSKIEQIIKELESI